MLFPTTELFQRYLWLIDIVHSAGEISRDEINRRWVNSPYNYDHEPEYAERSFHRHRDAILELFGIEIVCDKHKNIYKIANIDEMDTNGLRSWLVDTFAIQNMVNLSGDLKGRILFERIPEGSRYLSKIASAMLESRQLLFTYQGFTRPEPHTFFLAPYCLKVFNRRWYLVGKPEDHPEEDEPRVYALDRVKEIVSTDKPFKLPRNFSAVDFFEGYFGVDRTAKYKPQLIRVKVSASTANYLRTLPLHSSQVEQERTDEYSIFTFFIAPTYDFVQELRKQGPELQIIEPHDLRDRFINELQSSIDRYKDMLLNN